MAILVFSHPMKFQIADFVFHVSLGQEQRLSSTQLPGSVQHQVAGAAHIATLWFRKYSDLFNNFSGISFRRLIVFKLQKP